MEWLEWDGSWMCGRGLAEAEGEQAENMGGASISCSSSDTNLQLNWPRYHLFYCATVRAACSASKTRARDLT